MIEVKNVIFIYFGSEVLVLEGVSFLVLVGWWLVIVGYNGFGKFILVCLIDGLLLLVVGEIIVDGLLVMVDNLIVVY